MTGHRSRASRAYHILQRPTEIPTSNAVPGLIEQIITYPPPRPPARPGNQPAPLQKGLGVNDKRLRHAPNSSPAPKKTAQNYVEKMATRRTLFCFRLYEAPRVDTIGENDPKQRKFQLLSCTWLVSFRLYFVSPNQPRLGGRRRGGVLAAEGGYRSGTCTSANCPFLSSLFSRPFPRFLWSSSSKFV